MNWMLTHLGDLVVLAVLALILGGIAAFLIRGRKKGKCCGCSGCSGCSGCAMAGSCRRSA